MTCEGFVASAAFSLLGGAAGGYLFSRWQEMQKAAEREGTITNSILRLLQSIIDEQGECHLELVLQRELSNIYDQNCKHLPEIQKSGIDDESDVGGDSDDVSDAGDDSDDDVTSGSESDSPDDEAKKMVTGDATQVPEGDAEQVPESDEAKNMTAGDAAQVPEAVTAS